MDLPSIKDIKMEGLTEEHPREWLLNEKNIGNAIMECLKENDPEGVVEVITLYLKALNKKKLHKKQNYLSKNPTIKSLAKIVHSMAH